MLIVEVLNGGIHAKRLKGLTAAKRPTVPMVLDHVTPEALPFAAALVAEALAGATKKRRLWLLCGDVKQQDHVHTELAVWGFEALYLPRLTAPVHEDVLPDPDLLAERATVLNRWREGGADVPPIMVCCIGSLTEPAPDQADVARQQRDLVVGHSLDVEAWLTEMEAVGYERVPVVTERGQMARRGGIVDVFSWMAEEPLRIEFFRDEIDSIRAFHVHNQASVRRLERDLVCC